jgi:hypothetical protein
MTSFSPLPPPAGGIFNHYTSRAAAREMSMAGQILLGRDGVIYLTDVLYRLGWQATDRLALPENNAEVVIPIPYADLPRNPDGSPAVEYRGVVPEWPSGSGRSFRRGGGQQWIVRQPIPLRIMPWSWVILEMP